MRIAFGTDEVTTVTDHLVERLRRAGHDVDVLAAGDPWPDVGHRVGAAVAGGDADVGVVCCWTGTGVSIAANKVAGVRAALCHDAGTAAGARKWNDANVLAVSLRSTAAAVADEIVDAFLDEHVDPTEQPNIDRVETASRS